MATSRTREEISEALVLFNKKVWNAGLYFTLDSFDNSSGLVRAKFDPFYRHDNVHIYFYQPLWTNLKIDKQWADAWNAPQLFLLEAEQAKEVADYQQIKIPDNYFVFQWNLENSQPHSGIIICQALDFIWF